MLPILNFYGNHALDFENNDYEVLEYYTISELRKIPIPDDIYIMGFDAIRKQFPGADISNITKFTEWCPVSSPGFPDIRKYNIKNIVSLGPMAMRIVFTPEYLILPSTIYERVDWYSPLNKEQVQAWRSYYYSVINYFGGDHALYVDGRVVNKHYASHYQPADAALAAFEQTLISHYGSSKKTLFDYLHGKYPKYYIDTFADIKHQEENQIKKG
jgi:hypothetical protein